MPKQGTTAFDWIYTGFLLLVSVGFWAWFRHRARKWGAKKNLIWIVDLFGLFLVLFVMADALRLHFPRDVGAALEAVGFILLLITVIKILPRWAVPFGLALLLVDGVFSMTDVSFWHQHAPGGLGSFVGRHLYELRTVTAVALALLVLPFVVRWAVRFARVRVSHPRED